MPNFLTEIRPSPREEYVKVYLKDPSKYSEVQVLLKGLPGIRNINITQNSKTDLTVYCAKTYSAKETVEEITAALNNYFESKPIDPVFKDQNIEAISEKAYRQIIDRIYQFGKNLEKYQSLYNKFDEEGFRDFFLPHLNSISTSHTATGETFNKKGKTDILIQNTKGENVFIAECKLWKGEGEIHKAIDQLLERYVTWRDEKLALIFFNKSVKGFTEILKKAVDAITSHPSCLRYKGKTHDSCHAFEFKHPEDSKKTIEMELIMFNCT